MTVYIPFSSFYAFTLIVDHEKCEMCSLSEREKRRETDHSLMMLYFEGFDEMFETTENGLVLLLTALSGAFRTRPTLGGSVRVVADRPPAIGVQTSMPSVRSCDDEAVMEKVTLRTKLFSSKDLWRTPF